MSHVDLVAALTARWPEHRVAPSLGRIRALTELLGDPQRTYPVIHVAGTNGKGSTAAMIESLLRAAGLRTGRFSSPHLTSVTERIMIDGRPIEEDRFDATWADIEPYVAIVDERQIDGVAMTFFEIITAMAFAAFADAPVDVAVIEVGLGGSWDATNVADGAVAVITPIDLDHTHLLGSTVDKIAGEKAGIIKPGAQAILAGQPIEAATVLLARCAEVGALVQREGIDFGLLSRSVAVGGQLIRINASGGPVEDIFLPLHGGHQAANAAQAVAAVEAFLGMRALEPDVIRAGLAEVKIPGRLEVIRRSPTVLLDAAHNPHGARAAAAGVAEAFAFSPVIAVLAVMRDKDARGLLTELAEVVDRVVVTQVASTDRGMPAEALGELAGEIFAADRIQVEPRLDDAIEAALALADADEYGNAGILVTGSVIAVGEARTLLAGDEPWPENGRSAVAGDDDDPDEYEDEAPADDGDWSRDDLDGYDYAPPQIRRAPVEDPLRPLVDDEPEDNGR
jgi:dihydrofolate synthase/folylpolyglutamate synthase